jgi:hypothetical protein
MAMPDATGPVRLAPLKTLASDHFWALVLFPAAWQRLRPGHYEVDEDFLLLSGDLAINEQQWRAREHGFVPAHTLRQRTFSERGCLACARFHGRPRWQAGPSRGKPASSICHRPSWQGLPATDFLGLGRAPRVFEHAGMSQWLLSPALRAALGSRTPPFDELDLSTVDAALEPAFWARLSSDLAAP